MTAARLHRVAAAFLIVSGVLLLAGRTAEDTSHDEATEPAGAQVEDREHSRREGHGEEGEAESAETSAAEEPEEETILGIDLESPKATIGALAASILLALGLLSSRARLFAGAVLGLGVVFALFDVAELAHQVEESRLGIALLAGLVALGHLAASGAAGISLRDRSHGPRIRRHRTLVTSTSPR